MDLEVLMIQRLIAAMSTVPNYEARVRAMRYLISRYSLPFVLKDEYAAHLRKLPIPTEKAS